MSLDEKRIRIAEFLGQGPCRMCGRYHTHHSQRWNEECTVLPNYLEDRNVMVEALTKLPKRKRTEFGEWLLTCMLHKDVITDYPVTMAAEDGARPSELCGSLDLVYHIAQASAWMLAQAFAETLGLWEETPDR